MTYGEALEQVKLGKLAARSGWNGKGMFIFMRPGDQINYQVLPNIKSLPQAVKDWYSQWGHMIPTINFTPYLCMKDANNFIVNGWLASQTDMLAEDWIVL